MIHKNCEGNIVEIEYACAVQLHCDMAIFFPQGYKLVDSFPIGHLSQGYFTLTTMMKESWDSIGKKLRALIIGG